MAILTKFVHHDVKALGMKHTGGLPPPRRLFQDDSEVLTDIDHAENPSDDFRVLMRALAVFSVFLLLIFLVSAFFFMEWGAFEYEIRPRFDWHQWEPGTRPERVR